MAESTDAPIAKSDLMLRDALEALSLADSSLLESQIQPYRLPELIAEASVVLETTPTTAESATDSFPPKSNSQNTSHEIRIELGRTRIPPKELYEMSEQALIMLDSSDHDLVDLFAGETRLAKGQVLCLDGRICFRVVELFSQQSLSNHSK